MILSATDLVDGDRSEEQIEKHISGQPADVLFHFDHVQQRHGSGCLAFSLQLQDGLVRVVSHVSHGHHGHRGAQWALKIENVAYGQLSVEQPQGDQTRYGAWLGTRKKKAAATASTGFHEGLRFEDADRLTDDWAARTELLAQPVLVPQAQLLATHSRRLRVKNSARQLLRNPLGARPAALRVR